MTELPASIEAYLVEADFSGTEILILRKLLEGHAMTLREIGGKTGKSPGVLDQAMKKLVGKHIIGREMINGNPKFVLSSLDAIANWIKEDMRKKREVMKRKQEDFESFIASLKIDHSKPEIHYFYGDEGIEQAYLKLLEYGKEMLVYKPVIYKEEEDPHQDFYKKLRAERSKRGISMRVLAYDTPLGRRYQSRDMFENRKTTLISEQSYAFNFEKIIIGNTIACIDHAEKKASIIRYEELVHTERVLFDTLWNQPRVIGSAPEQKEERMLEPETLEELKEFLFSKRSVVAFVLCACIAAGVTYALYRHNVYLNTQRVREHAMTVAVNSVSKFDVNDINQIHAIPDVSKSEYKRVVNTLQEIRSSNTDIAYAYIMRATKDPYSFEFVADADSLSIQSHNKDRDGMNATTYPGYTYVSPDITTEPLVVALKEPTADSFPYSDRWGTWISGYAPIKDESGNTVAIFCADVAASEVDNLSHQTFNALLIFIITLFLLCLVRLAIFNRSLMKEIFELLKTKKVVASIVAYVLFAALVTYGFRLYALESAKQRVQDKVLAIAATGVLKFDAEELTSIQNAEDVRKPAYKEIVKKLNEIKNQNDRIAYVYIMRPTVQGEKYTFVADSASGDPFAKNDRDNNGVINQGDDPIFPGELYDNTGSVPPTREALMRPTAFEPYTDKWGTFISGWAPMKDKNDQSVAILGVDMDADIVPLLSAQTFAPFSVFIGLLVLLILFRPSKLRDSLFTELLDLLHNKKFLLFSLFYVLCTCALTIAIYWYTESVNLARAREMIQSIAVTGALQIDAKDVEKLQVQDDWKKPEWAKVVHILERIRKENPNILYVYILRKNPHDRNLIDFVSDSHSLNPFANSDDDPTNDVEVRDEGRDPGVPDSPESDVLTWPGQPYNEAPVPDIMRAYSGPYTTPSFYEDIWGIQISSYAPIRDASGRTVAVLAVDMSKPQVEKLRTNMFILFAISVILLIAIIIFRPSKFKESLLKDLFKVLCSRRILTSLLLCGFFALLLTYVMYRHTLRLMHDEVGTRLMSIAATAAPHIDPHDVESLKEPNDIQTPEYGRLFVQLNEIKKRNPGVEYAWILRPTTDEKVWQWVADADSSKEIGPFTDENGDGIMQPEEQNVYPGATYQITENEKEIAKSLLEPKFEKDFVSDQWGAYITAYAPIKDMNGRGIAVLGIDMKIDDFKVTLTQKFIPWVWVSVIYIALIGLFAIGAYKTK